MFAVVGHSVAVGNADPEVLAAAAEICPSVEENGFAQTVGRFGLLRPHCAGG
jgi:hydroxymethylpyrimidine pyrophosphatase-like HAD family hydrolase